MTHHSERALGQLIEAHRQELAACLLSQDDLRLLRERVDEAWEGSAYCDGCGMCCTDDVPVTRLEYDRIAALLASEPELLTPQGYVCPFLELDHQRFADNLQRYGSSREPLEAMGCRIYLERPMLCRLYPLPHRTRCREHDTIALPNVMGALMQADREDYPQLLIHKYYLTLRLERFGLAHVDLGPDRVQQLVPGWVVDGEQKLLACMDGPHWIKRYQTIPDDFPIPELCALEDWAVAIVERLQRPATPRELLAELADGVSPTQLGVVLARLEALNAIVPRDIGQRLHEVYRTFWSWRQMTATTAAR